MAERSQGLWAPEHGEHGTREQALIEWGRSGAFRPNLAFDADTRMVLGGIVLMLRDIYPDLTAHKEEPHLSVLYVNPRKLYESLVLAGVLVDESSVYEAILGVKSFCLDIPRVVAADLGATLVNVDIQTLGEGNIIGVGLRLSEALYHYISTIRAILISRIKALGVTEEV